MSFPQRNMNPSLGNGPYVDTNSTSSQAVHATAPSPQYADKDDDAPPAYPGPPSDASYQYSYPPQQSYQPSYTHSQPPYQQSYTHQGYAPGYSHTYPQSQPQLHPQQQQPPTSLHPQSQYNQLPPPDGYYPPNVNQQVSAPSHPKLSTQKPEPVFLPTGGEMYPVQYHGPTPLDRLQVAPPISADTHRMNKSEIKSSGMSRLIFISLLCWVGIAVAIFFGFFYHTKQKGLISKLWVFGIFVCFPYIICYIMSAGFCFFCQSRDPSESSYRGGKYIRSIDIIHSALNGTVLTEAECLERVQKFVKGVPKVYLKVVCLPPGTGNAVPLYVGYYPLHVVSVVNTSAPFNQTAAALSKSAYRPIVVFDPKYTFSGDPMINRMKQELHRHFTQHDPSIRCRVTVVVEEPESNVVSKYLAKGELDSSSSTLCSYEDPKDDPTARYMEVLQLDNEMQPGCETSCLNALCCNSPCLFFFTYLSCLWPFLACWDYRQTRVRFECWKHINITNAFHMPIHETERGVYKSYFPPLSRALQKEHQEMHNLIEEERNFLQKQR